MKIKSIGPVPKNIQEAFDFAAGISQENFHNTSRYTYNDLAMKRKIDIVDMERIISNAVRYGFLVRTFISRGMFFLHHTRKCRQHGLKWVLRRAVYFHNKHKKENENADSDS